MRPADVEGGAHFCGGLIRQHAPETGDLAALAPGTVPEKLYRLRVFRTEDFQSLPADDSDVGLQHVLISTRGEFRVNTYTTSTQFHSTVAMDADGDFVVTWSSKDQDGGGGFDYGVYAQRYNAAGLTQGSEFRVNTFTTGDQRSSTVAMDADGDFVVTWEESNGQDGSGDGVYAQRYNAAGVAQGSEFRVNTFNTNFQSEPTVAMDADGDFVVTWRSDFQDGSAIGVYAQRYNATGVAQGDEFRVNSFTTGFQLQSRVAMDADGDFVVTWSSIDQDGGDYGVYAQRYNAAGVAQGSEFRVNSFTTDRQRLSTVAMDADGDFVVTWTSIGQDGSLYGIYAQRYNAAGVAQGSEFRVNTFTASGQRLSPVAMDADGDFVVAWSSYLQDGNFYGVYAQRYDDVGPDDADNAGPTVTDVLVSGDRLLANEQLVAPPGSVTVVFSEKLSAIGGAIGANSVTNPANWGLTKNGVNASGLIGGVSFGLESATAKYEAVVYFTAPLTAGDYVLTAKGTSAITDLFGNALDGNADGTPGGDYTRAFRVRTPQAKGNEFRVNTFTTGTQRTLPESPQSVAMDADGDFVVTWTGDSQPGGNINDIYAQRYNAAGVAQGSEFRVNSFTTGDQLFSTVAMDADGDFVITWSSNAQDGDAIGVYAQRYNAAGVAQGSEFQVNTVTTNFQFLSTVAMDADGDFVVTWSSYLQDGSSYGVYAQRYNGAGVAQGSEFQVNTYTTQGQRRSTVAMDADGDFVVTWASSRDDSDYGIYAQRFNAAGVAQGSEFRVSAVTTGNQTFSTVAMEADGDFVVTWTSGGQDGSNDGVYAERYNAAGVAQGSEFRVNTRTTDNQQQSTVAMDADGDFTITWSSFNQDGSSYGVYAQRYNAAGVAQGSEFRVNTFTTNEQRWSALAMDADGDFVVAWTSLNQDGSSHGVYAQRYGGGTTPTAFPIAPVTNEDTPINGGLLWASDPETPIDQLIYTITTPAAHGTVTKVGVRGFNYVPHANYNGPDSFKFTVSDGQLVSPPTTVSITVNAVNDKPTAFPINPVINEDTSLIGGLLWASDVETPIDSLTYSITSSTAHGVVSRTGVRGFNYVPTTDYNGMDSFQFTASDGVLTSLPATVTITINPVAGVPQAFDATASTNEDTSLNGGLMWGYDEETPMNSLAYAITSLTGHGTVTKTGVRSFRYVPAAGFTGVDSFRYTASDGQNTSAPATMTIHVMPVNSAPRAFNSAIGIDQRSAMVGGSSRAFDSEAPADGLTFALSSLMMNGTVMPTGDRSANEIPNPNFTGVATLSKWPGDKNTKRSTTG